MHILSSLTSYTDSATLAGNTDYLVVFKATGNSAADCQLGGTTSDAEDASGATGWSIEDTRRFNGTVTLFGVDFLISLSGTVDTTPPTPSSGHNVNTNGGYVDLFFDEDLDENFPPPASGRSTSATFPSTSPAELSGGRRPEESPARPQRHDQGGTGGHSELCRPHHRRRQ